MRKDNQKSEKGNVPQSIRHSIIFIQSIFMLFVNLTVRGAFNLFQ